MLGHLLLAISACLPVEGDRIRLHDLAAAIPAFAGGDEEESIAFAPAPGVQRRFSAGELSRLAARRRISTSIEPVCFERRLTSLTREQVLTALRLSLPNDAELELISFSDVLVPAGPLEFSRVGLARARPASPREPLIWKGRVTYATAHSVTVWAKVRVWISRPAAVAAENLQTGKPIGDGQIRIEAVDSPPFFDTASVSLDTFSGMIPRRPIRAGRFMSKTDVEAPADVSRGEMVGIEAHVGAASLKFEVRAEGSGRAGDVVAVRNVDSGKTFRARILRKGWVAVE